MLYKSDQYYYYLYHVSTQKINKCGCDVFLKDAGVVVAIFRKSALKFSEHVSANTSKFNAYRL